MALLCLGSSAAGATGQRGLSLVSEGQPLLLSGLHVCASADGLIFTEWPTGFCLLADRMR